MVEEKDKKLKLGKRKQDDDWVDMHADEVKAFSVDERFILRFYQFSKKNWKFYLGVLVGMVIVLFIIK